MKIWLITALNRVSAGIYEDISGVAIQDTMMPGFGISYRAVLYRSNTK